MCHKSHIHWILTHARNISKNPCVRKDSEDKYLYYALVIQSGNQHRNLKVDIQNDFTTGNNLYPNFRPQPLHLLGKYSKIAAPKMPASQGSPFAQGYVKKVNVGERRTQQEMWG